MAAEKGTFTFRVDGLRELDQALGELSKVTARRVGRRALKTAGDIIAKAASALAPDDPETSAPDLHTSIIVSTRLVDRRGLAEFANEMSRSGNSILGAQAIRDARRANPKDSTMTLAVGPAKLQGTKRNPGRYAHLVEFGTVHSAAQPFMTPAWESNKNKTLETIASELKTQIAKAAARAARRKAKGTGGK